MEAKLNCLDNMARKVGKQFDGGIDLHGWFEIKHIRNGEVIDHRVLPNLITNAGKAQVAGLINGVVTDYFDYIAIGTGTTAPSASDTALEGEVARGSADRSRVTTSVTNDTAQFVYTFTFDSSYAITESGVFDADSGGNMLCRQTFSEINVASGDSLQITWKVQSS